MSGDKGEQIAALTAGLWAIYSAVGGDTDRDETPAALIAGMGISGFVGAVKEEVAAHLDSDEEGEREAAAEAVRKFAAELRSRYPEDIWKPLERADHRLVNDALAGRVTGCPISRDRVSADMMRRAAAQADEYANDIEATS